MNLSGIGIQALKEVVKATKQIEPAIDPRKSLQTRLSCVSKDFSKAEARSFISLLVHIPFVDPEALINSSAK